MEKLKKEKTGFIITCIGICVYLFDSITDYILGVYYLREGDVWNGSLTLAFVLVPCFLNSVYAALLHYSSNGKLIKKLKIPSTLVYPFCIVLQGQLSRLIVWMYFLHAGVVNQVIAKELVWVNRDMVFYPEIFIQSIPQLYNQMYVIVVLTGDFTVIQVLTCIASVIAASWGVLTLFNTFLNKLLAFEMSVLWLSSRIAAIIVLASVRKEAPFALLFVHFVFVLPLWFYEIKRRPFDTEGDDSMSRFQVVILDSFYAVIYGVCNTATPIVSAFYLPLSIAFFFENIGCYAVAYKFGNLYGRNYTNSTNGMVHFEEWGYASPFLGVFGIISILAFIQCLVIFLLKNKNVIRGEFFQSQIINLIKAIREQRESTQRRHRNLKISSSSTLRSTIPSIS